MEATKQIDSKSPCEWDGDCCRKEGNCCLKEGDFHSHSCSFFLQNALASSSGMVCRVYSRNEDSIGNPTVTEGMDGIVSCLFREEEDNGSRRQGVWIELECTYMG